MRKQTKIAAIVSAAALLAVGASMTSFAATGWQEEDGTWVYYNKAEERVTDKWAKSGDNWFYLDSDGYMATDMLIEDDDEYYYVDANGAMVRNQWIAIDNENAGDEDEPEVHWYYFQNNGKAYKKKGDSKVFKKSINGKTYCFNQDGQMQYGWVSADSDGETDYDDAAWKVQGDQYYFGDENDGAMSIGWRLISIVDDEGGVEDQQPGDSFWDEDQDRWFYFKSSGKKEYLKDGKEVKGKTINGKKYGFDEYGRMIADWYTNENPTIATLAGADPRTGSDAQGKVPYTESFMYFSSPEDGARWTKGWFKVIPGYYLNQGTYDDGDNKWYYADGQGHLVAGQIKTIKGKKYGFDTYGRMMDGLVIVTLTDKASNEIVAKIDKDDNYSDEDAFKKYTIAHVGDLASETMGVYYFSGDADHDGTMKTGKQTVKHDGDSLSFRFYDSGAHKGMGITGAKDKKVYIGGLMLKADSDDKVAWIDKTATDDSDLYVTFKQLFNMGYFVEVTDPDDAKKDQRRFEVTSDTAKAKKFYENFVPVNSSGAVMTSGTKKDGDDYKITFKNNKRKVALWGDTEVTIGDVTKVILK